MGFNSTISAPTMWLPLREDTISKSSRELIPAASGLPTPGANAGSSTSRSKLAYVLFVF